MEGKGEQTEAAELSDWCERRGEKRKWNKRTSDCSAILRVLTRPLSSP